MLPKAVRARVARMLNQDVVHDGDDPRDRTWIGHESEIHDPPEPDIRLRERFAGWRD